MDSNMQQIGEVFKGRNIKKPPAYPWQELALRVIKELNIPGFKRNSVFKVCKVNTSQFVERCLNDTKELCQTGQKWKYFFKLIDLGPARQENNKATLSSESFRDYGGQARKQ